MLDLRRKRQVLVVTEGQAYTWETETALRQADRFVSTIAFHDGPSALAHLARCGIGSGCPVPDLLLLDLVMPNGPDGMAVLGVVRRMEPLGAMRVLVVSSSGEDAAAAEALGAGANGCLVKPVQKDDYPAFARQICTWLSQESWSEVGPSAAQNALAIGRAEVGSSLVMPANAPLASLASPGGGATEPSLLQQLKAVREYCIDFALQSVDPFQYALSQACRRHHIKPVQMLHHGGSHQLLANRRAVLVDLITEGWPNETLQEVCPVNNTELKRLRKLARDRAKLGPKLDLRLS